MGFCCSVVVVLLSLGSMMTTAVATVTGMTVMDTHIIWVVSIKTLHSATHVLLENTGPITTVALALLAQCIAPIAAYHSRRLSDVTAAYTHAT